MMWITFRRRLLLLTICAGMVLPSAYAVGEGDLKERIEKMEDQTNQQIAELKAEVQYLREQLQIRGISTPAPPKGPGTDYIPRKSQEFQEKGISPTLGGVYTKPFLRRYGRNVYVGGYMDMEYIDDEDSNARFRQHRLIPFIYADVSDRVKFATEIEFEDGGPDNNQGDGEVKVEFATIDYLINEKINFRTGILLSPLGKFNLVHDSPLRDLINRPLVDTFIIPTTLSEAGAGFYGTFYPTEMSKLDYEFYLVNGFAGITSAGVANITTARGVRGARGSQRSDINDNPAFVGRLAFSPWIGLETGFSAHVGDYDATGEQWLAIYALDLTYQKGPFELLFEGAFGDLERNDFAKSLGLPDQMWGYYVQGNYHFLPQFLKDRLPNFFTEESTFTLSVRWDQMDIGGSSTDRLTVGLNFRPTEDTVFKLAHEWNFEDRRLNNTPNNEIQASVATYF